MVWIYLCGSGKSLICTKVRKRMDFVDREEFDLKELKRFRKDSFYWYANDFRKRTEFIK